MAIYRTTIQQKKYVQSPLLDLVRQSEFLHESLGDSSSTNLAGETIPVPAQAHL